MNIRDLEETIRTLKTRHPGLTEAMLLTLLRAGGWEEKDIQTAKTLFVSSSPVSPPVIAPSSVQTDPPVIVTSSSFAAPEVKPVASVEEGKESIALKNLPVQEEMPMFVPIVDESHLVEAPHEEEEKKDPMPVQSFSATQESKFFVPIPDESHLIDTPHEDKISESVPVQNPPVPEPVSLVERTEPSSVAGKEDLPHNLPLRPFESSEHIWPFSRYRDIFYGEEEISSVPVQLSVQSATSEPKLASPMQSPITPVQPVVSPPPLPQKKEEVSAVPLLPPEVMPVREPLFHAPPQAKERVVIVEKTGDEKLVIMACVMLLAILLLLGYMYSNGRL